MPVSETPWSVPIALVYVPAALVYHHLQNLFFLSPEEQTISKILIFLILNFQRKKENGSNRNSPVPALCAITIVEACTCHWTMKGSMLEAIALLQRELFHFIFPNISPSSHGECKELVLLYPK